MKRNLLRQNQRPANVPVRTVQFNVAGVTKPNRNGTDRQRIISAIAPGVGIELNPEPTNRYDPNAVAVHFHGEQIGYVPADLASRVSKYLSGGHDYEARVLDVVGGTEEFSTVGVIVEGAFWRGGEVAANFYSERRAHNKAARIARGLSSLKTLQPSAAPTHAKGALMTVLLFIALITVFVLYAAMRLGRAS